jgi:hypothetical protein
VHATQRFDGSLGSFTLRVNVTFTLTDNPNVALDEGTWVVLDGTGAYATLRGQGRITGTEDEAADLIQRTYTGTLELG